MNSMEAYVERRMPLLWKLIIPLNSRGVMLDQVQLKKFQQERQRKLRTWQSRAKKHFKDLDLGELPIGPKGGFSNPKLRALLYEKLALPPVHNPKDGKVTAGKDALKRLAKRDKTGTCDLLRENSLLAETRTAEQVKPGLDGRVRTRFVWGGDEKYDEDEAGKESPGSGRLASRDPNLQNVPKWFRQIYIASHPDRWLLKADYSQIEMRITARLSGDRELLKALKTDAYTHSLYLVDKETDLYGLHPRGLKKLIAGYRVKDPDVVFARDETKRTALGWSYRMGAKKLEMVRGVPFDRGKKALKALNMAFPGVVRWWDELTSEVHRNSQGTGRGFLTNEWGRVRFLYLKDVPRICNFKPQSIAADILYDAMERLEARFAKDGIDARLILTVHDEVVIDCLNPEDVIPIVKEEMEFTIPEMDGFSVPVDIDVGKNWASYHKHGPTCKAHCSLPENLLGQRPWEEWN